MHRPFFAKRAPRCVKPPAIPFGIKEISSLSKCTCAQHVPIMPAWVKSFTAKLFAIPYMKLALLAVILFFSAAMHAAEVNVKKLNKMKWVSVSTESFQVVTDGGEKHGKAMAEELERFSYFLTEMLGFKSKPTVNRVPLLLAKSSRTYGFFGLNENISGVFWQRENNFAIIANGREFTSSKNGGLNEGRQTILHELVHFITQNAEFKIATPPWYAEGIAEYFGTYTEKKDQIIIGQLSLVGFRFYSMLTPSGRWQSIDVESLIKAPSVGFNRKKSKENDKYISQFYARSFALVHYLNADPERRNNMYVYLLLLKKGYSVDQSFKAAFETTYEKMTQEVDEYIQGKYVNARVFNIGEKGISFPGATFEVEKLSEKKAISFIVSKLTVLGPPIMSEQAKYDMMDSLREIYPGVTFSY